MKRHAGIALGLFVFAGCTHQDSGPRALGPLDPANQVAAGLGRYATHLPPGEKPPSNAKGEAVKPKVTAAFQGPAPSNDWWSSLIWQYKADNPYSEPMFPHPLAMKAEARGLGVSYPSNVVLAPRSYSYPYARDLTLSVEGLEAPDTRVDAASEWVVTASWKGADAQAKPSKAMTATFGHGLPFVYVKKQGGNAVVELDAEGAKVATVFSDHDGTVGLTINGHHYGIFAPWGSSWVRAGATFSSTLEGADHFSIAALPDASPETLEAYRKHAFTFVTGSDVAWKYDVAAARLVTTFTLRTTEVEKGHGLVGTPLMALYRHQWMATRAAFTPYTYVSSRGLMKVTDAASFETEERVHGVLPVLPDAGTYDRGTLRHYVKEAMAVDDLFPNGADGKKDSYWVGKSLGKVATLVRIADQLGETEMRDELVTALKRELETWFSGVAPRYFAYDATWSTLIGIPSAYQSGYQMNDHHFHYGYFIHAAATVAAYDPAWAQDTKWGALVTLLAKDAANWDAKDTRFPRFRYFDAYAGHSWASGPAMFAAGNNEESSSEDLNFSQALVLWGAVTGNTEIRDVGMFLYETQVAAVSQYWFDVDREVFPKGFDHSAVGIVWGNGGTYDTWFDRNPVYIHGINILPITAGSLYLARRPDYVKRNYDSLVKTNRGAVQQWRDVMWMYLGIADAEQAVALYENDHYFDPEMGGSWASTYHWLYNLRALGSVDTTVTADAPSYGVFRKGATRTYAAYNPGAAPLHVTFSDGATIDVPAHTQRHVARGIAPASASPSLSPAAPAATVAQH